MERWKPNTTVATVVTRTGNNGQQQFLLVHEIRDGKKVFNQPAGHLDEGESLICAAKRETLEETGWNVEITGLIGIYRFIPANGTTYMRYAFTATPQTHESERTLDDGIIEAVWLDYDEIVEKTLHMRSQMVKQTVDDYLKRPIYPLEMLHDIV